MTNRSIKVRKIIAGSLIVFLTFILLTYYFGYYLLTLSIGYKFDGLTKLLVTVKPSNINSHVRYSQTPLILAVISKNDSIVSYLLKHGADPNKRDALYYPLHYAAEYNLRAIALQLLASGANVDALSRFEEATPLHIAVKYNSFDIVQLLIRHGADINAKTSIDNSVLHFAVNSDHSDIVKYLLIMGANINSANTLYGLRDLIHPALQVYSPVTWYESHAHA